MSIQLATLITTVKQQLVSQGFSLAERIPAVNAQFTIFQSADIPKVQRGYKLLNTLGYWMPFIVLGLGVIGIYVVPHHRRAAIVAGLALAGGMLLVAILLALARHRYLNAVPPAQLPPDAAAVLFDTIVRFLREALRAIALVGVVIAAGAFLTGPSVTATAVRRASTRAGRRDPDRSEPARAAHAGRQQVGGPAGRRHPRGGRGRRPWSCSSSRRT